MKLRISELAFRSGVKFGTSGARGLADEMSDLVCYAYTVGFLQYLRAHGELPTAGAEVAVEAAPAPVPAVSAVPAAAAAAPAVLTA